MPAGDTHPRVLLVSCYELGHEPLGLSVPAGVLRRAGVAVATLDLAVAPLLPGAFEHASLVGISTPMHTALRLGQRVAERVRATNPRAHIVFYGLYAGLHRHHLVPHLADSCLDAECEASLLDLARAVLASPDPRAVPAPERVTGRARERDMDLTPARDAVARSPRHVRLAVAGTLRDVASVQATRGCKHTCRHCPLPSAYDGTFYALPVDRVLADIEAAAVRGAQHITFADPDFLNGPTHALRIAREFARRFAGMTFDVTAKIEHLKAHPDVVAALHDAGCLFVVSAVESFNDTVLDRLDKGHTRADALAVIRALRARGLALRPSLLPFTPWESRESLSDLFDIVASEGLVEHIDPVQYSIRLLIPEGSLLLNEPSLAGVTGPFDTVSLSYSWRHSDPGMDALARELAQLAAMAARESEPVSATFGRMRALVSPDAPALSTHASGPAPRLTEDWFC